MSALDNRSQATRKPYLFFTDLAGLVRTARACSSALQGPLCPLELRRASSPRPTPPRPTPCRPTLTSAVSA